MQKHQDLLEHLRTLGSAVVAFSGGVDSTFLLHAAHQALGERCLAVTAQSCTFPARELAEAQAFCAARGIRHVVCTSYELEVEGFAQNPPNRCYLCKKELFSRLWDVAKAEGIEHILEGSNIDDEGDYRPGHLAVREMGAESPLRQFNFTKDEIRLCSQEQNLPTAQKPAFACLSSRFPYGAAITPEKLKQVEVCEDGLIARGFSGARVRHHGDVARIEARPAQLDAMFAAREEIDRLCRDAGFLYTALDLCGYRQGSMNAQLTTDN